MISQYFRPSNQLVTNILTAASISYIILLIFPAYRLYTNYLFINTLRTQGLHKIQLAHRLFVQQTSARLGITKKVQVYISELVSSPLTIGYLKPMILLPFAALNNLSISQTEAILLHELSHIKRYDYIINLIMSVIHTLMYFNPFVRLFMSVADHERESTCDQLVLNFSYDKLSYASALLTLQKLSNNQHSLALKATGHEYLLSRIEKIIGAEKKKGFRFNHLKGMVGALVCLVAFNCILIIKEEKSRFREQALAYTTFANPIYINTDKPTEKIKQPAPRLNNNIVRLKSRPFPDGSKWNRMPSMVREPFTDASLINVNFDVVDGSLTSEQKTQIANTVDATKKLLKAQWQDVEDSIADVMDVQEKAIAHQNYLNHVNTINWKNLENNLKASFNQVDWEKVNGTLSEALIHLQLDSLEKSYILALNELKKAELVMKAHTDQKTLLIPDISMDAILKAEATVKESLDTIQAIKTKKIIRL